VAGRGPDRTIVVWNDERTSPRSVQQFHRPSFELFTR
jgi:hypothetical protein